MHARAAPHLGVGLPAPHPRAAVVVGRRPPPVHPEGVHVAARERAQVTPAVEPCRTGGVPAVGLRGHAARRRRQGRRPDEHELPRAEHEPGLQPGLLQRVRLLLYGPQRPPDRRLARLRQGQVGRRADDGLGPGLQDQVERARDELLLAAVQRPAQLGVARVPERVTVAYQQGAVRLRVDPDRREHGRRLQQARRGRAVGQQQAVGDERAVVEPLAEVAAVRREQVAGGVRAGQAVVDPLPDEPAHQARVPVEQRVVVGQPARAVTHGVRVLALQERHAPAAGVGVRALQRRLDALPDQVHVLGLGVHPRVDVHVLAGPVALVVDRPARVERAHGVGHRGDVDAAAGLVAERPQDDARVVAVAAHHPGDAVDEHLGPVRVVDRVALPAALVLETVCLQVVLVDDVEAVPVAQVQEVRVRRVVARADRVDVVPLHEQHVLEHPLQGH